MNGAEDTRRPRSRIRVRLMQNQQPIQQLHFHVFHFKA